MNSRSTWILLTLAAVLFAFIFFFERHLNREPSGPPRVFPGMKAQDISSIQVQPRGQRAIHAVRTNGVWILTEPLNCHAQPGSVESLLAMLEGLTATPFLSGQDLKTIPESDTQFGFDTPQFSLMIDGKRYLVLIGRKTPPGDRVYVQLVGVEGVFVVNADLLRFLPQSVNQWRTTSVIDWTQLAFDRVMVTNAGKVLELQLNSTNHTWRMLSPNDVRADSGKVGEALKRLEELKVQQFVSDEPGADLEGFGLQPPELSLSLLQGTNTALRLDFGKSPTNNPALVYARKAGQSSVIAVAKSLSEPWQSAQSHAFRDFFDPHLLAISRMPDEIEVHALEHFTLQRQADRWRVLPAGLPADSNLMTQLFINLTNFQVNAANIEKDIVPSADLPKYGLGSQPFRQYILKAHAVDGDLATNIVMAQLDFGTNQDKVFARVQGESFVYSIEPALLDLLPTAGWQMRDRQLWNFTPDDVASVTIYQGNRTRQLLRKSEKNWTLAPGSQGIIDEMISAQTEEAIIRLSDLAATFWVERSAKNLAVYGISETSYRITIELKSGKKLSVQFGGEAPSRFPYAATQIDGETWVFEFPWTTYQFVQLFLTIPPSVP